MSECAHGSGPFANLTKAERIDVATRMIAIIKRRALANQTERMIGQRDGGIGSTTTASSQAGQSRHYN